MSIELSTQIIHASIASVLKETDPNAKIFDNPNQQGTPYPAWFIVHRSPVEIRKDTIGAIGKSNRFQLTYQIDIWYLLQQNQTALFDKYTRIAEELDSRLDYLKVYGTEDVYMHVYDRSWNLEMNCMRYSLTLKPRVVRLGTYAEKMQVLTLDVFLKTYGHLYRVRFANTLHPELEIDLPPTQFAYYGGNVVLPSLQGTHWDSDGTAWVPRAWTLGAFGESVGPIYEDVTTDLLWAHPVDLILVDED